MNQSRRDRLRDAMREWLPTEQHVYLYLLEFLAYPSGLCEASPELLARDTGLSRQSVRKALDCLTNRELDGAPLWFWDPKTFVGLIATWQADMPTASAEQAAARLRYARKLPTTSFVTTYIEQMTALAASRQDDARRRASAGSTAKPAPEAPPEDAYTVECRATKRLALYQALSGMRRVGQPSLVELHPSQPIGARLIELSALGDVWAQEYAAAVGARLDDEGRLSGVRHGRGETPPKAKLSLLLQQDVIDAVMDRTGGAS